MTFWMLTGLIAGNQRRLLDQTHVRHLRRSFIVTRRTGRAEIFRRVEERVPKRPMQPVADSSQTLQSHAALEHLAGAEINSCCPSEPETNLTTQENDRAQSVSDEESLNPEIEQPDPVELIKEIDRLKADQKMLVSSFSKRIDTMTKQLNELKLCVVQENCDESTVSQFAPPVTSSVISDYSYKNALPLRPFNRNANMNFQNNNAATKDRPASVNFAPSDAMNPFSFARVSTQTFGRLETTQGILHPKSTNDGRMQDNRNTYSQEYRFNFDQPQRYGGKGKNNNGDFGGVKRCAPSQEPSSSENLVGSDEMNSFPFARTSTQTFSRVGISQGLLCPDAINDGRMEDNRNTYSQEYRFNFDQPQRYGGKGKNNNGGFGALNRCASIQNPTSSENFVGLDTMNSFSSPRFSPQTFGRVASSQGILHPKATNDGRNTYSQEYRFNFDQPQRYGGNGKNNNGGFGALNPCASIQNPTSSGNSFGSNAMIPPARQLTSRPNFFTNKLMSMLQKIEIENEICRQELGIGATADAANLPPAASTNSSDEVNLNDSKLLSDSQMEWLMNKSMDVSKDQSENSNVRDSAIVKRRSDL